MSKSAQDIIFEDREKIVEKLIKKMEEGYVFTDDKWNSYWVRPQNPISKVYYKGINRMRLGFVAAEKDYKDPRWLTYKQAQEAGWSVKSGEHGTICEKWIFNKKEKVIDPVTKQEREIEVKLDKPIIKYFKVFNAEQIENIPPLEFSVELKKMKC